ncbi:MAG: hypothetical protein H5U38_12710, partial [Calditrichaeota bacterium]|nr:hypothetical protein [Calditrichota bacterium]
MGTFSFLKNVGAAIFGGGKNEAKEVETLLRTELGDRIKNLKVEFKNDTIFLYGQCDTHATKEKAILLAGNGGAFPRAGGARGERGGVGPGGG